MTIVAGGQQAPRKCCLSSSTGRVRGSLAFGSRPLFQPDDRGSTNLKNQRDIRRKKAIQTEMRSHAGGGPQLDSWYGHPEGAVACGYSPISLTSTRFGRRPSNSP